MGKMKNKKLITIASIIILVVVIMLFIFQESTDQKEFDEPINREIEFGSRCVSDGDCGDSLIDCLDGSKGSCENGCVYGVCTNCVPTCAGESQCGNITCSDSVRVCPDGRLVRCSNFCNIETGGCTECVPQCEVALEDKINYKGRMGKFNLDSVPCANASYTERKDLNIQESNITKIDLPPGYSVIIRPFSLNCEGAVDLTLSIPETFTDLRALRCRGEECNPVVTRYVTELRCGGEISQEFLREERYLEPKFMPVQIKEVSLNVTSRREVISDKYKVHFRGNSEELGVTLAMPLEAVEEPENPNLKIAGTPLIIRIRGDVEPNVNATITMPYIKLESFEEDSVGMYVKVDGGWEFIGGEINKDDRKVIATLSNLNEYLDEDNEIMLALMEVLCISCYGSSLTKVYQPAGGSKNAVILMHGFAPQPNTFQKLINDIKLTNQPLDVWTFDYSSTKPINETVKELLILFEKNHANYDNFYVVAHSLGGLIIQVVLHDSYLKNKELMENREPPLYNFLNKVRKVVLIATPNKGSPLLGVYRNLFDNIINDKGQALFNPNTAVMNDLVNGIITPRVPGIDYFVIAGIKSYAFNLLFFKLSTEQLVGSYEKNDGIISVKSAQYVGGGYIDNQCENYWELNLSHTELIQHPVARKVIGRIVTNDLAEKNVALFGRNRYFDLSLEDCSVDDKYLVIGKEILEEEVFDETGCKCGNDYCGEGEDEVVCPSDCAAILLSEERSKAIYLIIIGLVSFMLCFQYVTFRVRNRPHIKTLIDHIRVNYDAYPGRGYTVKQLRDAFLDRGWPKWVVDRSFRLLSRDFHRTYHKPLMEHLAKHLRKGYTEEQIKMFLNYYGWPRETLEIVFRGGDLEPCYTYKFKFKFLEGGGKSYFGIKKQPIQNN